MFTLPALLKQPSELIAYILHLIESTTPEFWTAVFTLGLLVTAVYTAKIGLAALATGAETSKLESMPFLVVAQSLTAPAADQTYVISAPDGGLVARLRPLDFRLDSPEARPGVTISTHYGGQPDWRRTAVLVKNVGRSPAVAVEIAVVFKLKQRLDSGAENPNDGEGLPGRDYPHPLDQTGGFGTITIPSLMPGETTCIVIQNRYAATASLTFPKSAGAASANPRSRLAIPLVAPNGIAVIK